MPRENVTILKSVISISANGANTGATFYQKKEFTVLQDAYAIKWENTYDELTDNQYLFLVGSISKTIFGNYEWTNKAGWEKIKFETIKLPTKNGEIDFEFMESFIEELEAQRIAELETYLTATGLNDYALTTEEQQALDKFNSGDVNFSEYKLGDLFELKSSKRKFDANKVDILENGKFHYIVRSSSNNGQKGFINENETFLNDGNTISFGQDTATIFYQKNPYFTGDKIKILKSKDKRFNEKNAQFVIIAMNKSFSCFSWGSSSFNIDIIKNQTITIPTKNNEIDFFYMETLISAIQKLAIKDVVLYKDKIISSTKEVCK